ncbi:MAG: hypothetical protein KOO62_12665, partial [candidate division Zixibacteria bacterium]|nr:hypothetical protein [candidate division Zixibacteria bacterium]
GYTIGLANDDERLYLLLRFRDPQWAMSIRTSGLSLWLNENGNNDKDFSLFYRGGPSPNELRQMIGRQGGESFSDQKFGKRAGQNMDSLQESFTCAIKDVIIEKTIVMDGSEGPSVAFAMDQGFFNYEFSVPLAESRVRYYGLDVSPGKKAGIGIKWGGSDRKSLDGRDMFGSGGDGFGMPSGGRGGMGGRKGGGGMSGGKRPEMRSKSNVVELWARTTLAESLSQ